MKETDDRSFAAGLVDFYARGGTIFVHMRNVLTVTKAPESGLFSHASSNFSFFIRLFRVHSWCYQLGIPFLAVLHSTDVRHVEKEVGVFAFSAIYFSWGYVFNNLFDLGEDSVDRNTFKALRWRYALALTLVLHAAFLGLALAQGLLLEAALVSAVNAAYSVPPYRLKRFLLPSLISNGLFFSFPYYASVRILNGVVTSEDLRVTLLIFLLFLPLQFVHFLEHEEAEGKEVTPVRRATAAAFFTALCVAALWMDTAGRWGMPQMTVAYSAAAMMILLRIESASKARVAIRYVSMVFGLYLVASSSRIGL